MNNKRRANTIGTLKRTIGALAFGAVLALSLAANTTEAFAASVDASHGTAIERGPGSWQGTGPFDALGITWE